MLLAQPVELRPLRVDAPQRPLVGAVGEVGVQVVICGEQVEGGVDAEQQHLHLPGEHGQLGGLGVVGAHADVADDALFLLLLHVLEKFPLKHAVEVLLRVHVVDHPQVDVVGLQPGEQVLEGLPHQGQLPGADVLALLPGGAEVPLDDPLLPAALDGAANLAAHLRVGHPAVQNVDALFLAPADDGGDLLLVVALQPLGPQADFADREAGVP